MINDIKTRFELALEDQLMMQCGQSEPELTEMVRYHFGWHADGEQRGKRLRPIMHILATMALGSTEEAAMSSAIALETFHNFTLVHDDIQDKGEFRQGRLAMWQKYGMEQSINTGDFMSYAAFSILNQNNHELDEHQGILLNQTFTLAGLDVMRGQHLDMRYEKMAIVKLEQYLKMITYKTARLFSLAFEMAGIINQVETEKLTNLRAIGKNIGIAFQIQDDYLGIWGDPLKTGKSVSTDIMTKKKTYPLLIGLNNIQEMLDLWNEPAPLPDDVIGKITNLLSDNDIDTQTLNAARSYKLDAINLFEDTFRQESEAKQSLLNLLSLMII
mgnify:FL=1|jgi:geranylgeranyl pyrophosphate synthase